MLRRISLLILALASLSAAGFLSQAVGADAPPVPFYSGMQWRLVGPFRGGWSTMAVGVPSQPNVFYFGGAEIGRAHV